MDTLEYPNDAGKYLLPATRANCAYKIGQWWRKRQAGASPAPNQHAMELREQEEEEAEVAEAHAAALNAPRYEAELVEGLPGCQLALIDYAKLRAAETGYRAFIFQGALDSEPRYRGRMRQSFKPNDYAYVFYQPRLARRETLTTCDRSHMLTRAVLLSSKRTRRPYNTIPASTSTCSLNLLDNLKSDARRTFKVIYTFVYQIKNVRFTFIIVNDSFLPFSPSLSHFLPFLESPNLSKICLVSRINAKH